MASDPPDTASTDDDQTLRERVAELEATVEQQQQTISRLLPGRRGVLKAGALLGGGGVLGALSADRASAQAAGQVGTQSEPVDVEAYDLAVQNQLSSNVDAGGNDITNVGSLSTDKADSRSGYTDVTASRTLSTTETNNTGSDLDIIVTVQAESDNIAMGLEVIVDGEEVNRTVLGGVKDGNALSIAATIANGSDYQVRPVGQDANFSIRNWREQQ